MKTRKLLSIVLSLVMVLSLSVPAFASNTTTFTYTGAGNESYTVTVPAELAPGGSGTVKLEGTWQSNRVVTIDADKNVTLTNDISGGDAKELAITFEGIELAGDNTKSLSTSKTISVASISNALFGTWMGTFNYTVSIADDIKLISFKIANTEYQAEEGMTWGEWVASEYNTDGYAIHKDKGFVATKESGNPASIDYVVNGTVGAEVQGRYENVQYPDMLISSVDYVTANYWNTLC